MVVSAVPLAVGFGDDAGSESAWAARAHGDGGGGGGASRQGADGDAAASGSGSNGSNGNGCSGHAPHPLRSSLGIGMTFNECHEVRVYEDARRAEKEGASGGRGGGEGGEELGWGEDDADDGSGGEKSE